MMVATGDKFWTHYGELWKVLREDESGVTVRIISTTREDRLDAFITIKRRDFEMAVKVREP
jgi:hypothetical protein